MIWPNLSQKRIQQLVRWGRFGMVAGVFVASAAAMTIAWPRASVGLAGSAAYPVELRTEYGRIVQAVRQFEARQQQLRAQIVSDEELTRQLSVIQIDADSGQFREAQADIRHLRQALANWNLELSGGSGVATGVGQPSAGGLALPILLYHYPPPDFEQQLVHLEQTGHTVIDLDQALAGLRGEPLPPKPVVITFDDGFAAQMGAAEILQRHHMKATFYIIDGGEASRWCIGASRRYGDPLQPRGGCGDAYLSWDQIRELDHNPLFTIGGHTVNHRNLATLSAVDQRFEIETGKEVLEAQLGHAVKHFAYPYGSFTPETVRIVQQAGYLTATTTVLGTQQPPGSMFTLRRVRDALLLP